MNWDWEINPRARAAFEGLADELTRLYLIGQAPYWFRAFEGYRSPERQLKLFQTSRKDGKRVTNARPFQSAHQYGLAVDFVPFIVRAPDDANDPDPKGAWR